jgi:cytochrome c biogenesis protein CcdA
MGGLLTTGSILAAFFAGAVALFSPCCIVFLFPAYLASAVKARRWCLLPLTLVFAAGIAVVLLPITLGIGMVATALARYHTPLYVAGGLLMLGLAVLALSGRSWNMPSFIRAPDVQRSDAPGVFALGVFSGIASSCCAPVLAGVMTLSVLSSSTVGAASLGLAYVFGMVFPLVLMALLWDRLRLGERRLFAAKPVRLRIAGRTLHTNTLNVAVAVAFALMGAAVLALGISGNETIAGPMQLAVGRWLSDVFGRAVAFLDPVPEPVLGLGLLGLGLSVFIVAIRGRRAPQPEGVSHEHEDPSEDQEQLDQDATAPVGASIGGAPASGSHPARTKPPACH